MRDSIQILQKVFRLRTCEDSVFQHRNRACLLYQIKRCSGPCVGHISHEDYKASVREAVTFLNGKTGELTQTLHHKMQQASNNLDFEAAVVYRDQIKPWAWYNLNNLSTAKARTTLMMLIFWL